MKTIALASLCIGLLVLSGCCDPNHATDHVRIGAMVPAGFWRGLWHGICAPWSLIGIMFGWDIGIYDAYNTGNWYNFGFLTGTGSLSCTSRAANRR